ncbi:MAG: hypothetical protein ACPHER_06105, partial [Nevskiales bacterium]
KLDAGTDPARPGAGRGQAIGVIQIHETPLQGAGAAIGGKIGHDVYKKDHQPKRVENVTYEPRCKTVTDYQSVEKPNGYDVTYEYKGQTYTTHMDEAPQGEYIPVQTEIRLQTNS